MHYFWNLCIMLEPLFGREKRMLILENKRCLFAIMCFIIRVRLYFTTVIFVLYHLGQLTDKCDRFEQNQACGCILTNPLHVTLLRPGSIFIDGFSWTIYQKIADFNSYPLMYQF